MFRRNGDCIDHKIILLCHKVCVGGWSIIIMHGDIHPLILVCICVDHLLAGTSRQVHVHRFLHLMYLSMLKSGVTHSSPVVWLLEFR